MTLDQGRLYGYGYRRLLHSLNQIKDDKGTLRWAVIQTMCPGGLSILSCLHQCGMVLVSTLPKVICFPIFEARPMYESRLQVTTMRLWLCTRLSVAICTECISMNVFTLIFDTAVHQESKAIRQNLTMLDVFASNPICHCRRLAAHFGTVALRKHYPISAIFCQVEIVRCHAGGIFRMMLVLTCCKTWSIQNADKRSQEVLKGLND